MRANTIRNHRSNNILSRRTIEFAAVLVCYLGLNLIPALAAPGSWTRKADMPMALDAHASCAVDGILYVMGGHAQANHTQLRILFAYDPKTDLWTNKANMPTARRFLAAAVVDGIIYATGGGGYYSPPTDAVEAYDPKTDTWVTRAKLTKPRFAHAACAVNGIIYVMGGGDKAMNPLLTMEAYDPKTDQWTPRTNMPQRPSASGAVSATLVDGLIYLFYGTATFVYDPQNDRWTTKARIPSGSLYSYFTASSAVDGIVYLFGGSSADGYTTYSLSVAYDPIQDRFTAKRKIPVQCEGAACATIDGKIYHTGGISADPDRYPNTYVYYANLWVFDPQGGVAPQSVSLTVESANQVRLVWQGEAGRLYGVQSTLNAAKGPWTRVNWTTGTNSILATNALIEGSCAISTADTNRFFRIIEAN